MKSACLGSALVLSLLVAWAWAAPSAPAEIDTVDRAAIATNESARFIENAFWPTEAVIAAKRVSNDLVGPDIEELKVLLQRALKEEFLPSEQDVAGGVLAVEGLRNANDYLLLRYETKQYLMQGGDVFSLQLILGHSSLEMVKVYVNLAMSDVSKQHRKYSPVDNIVLARAKR